MLSSTVVRCRGWVVGSRSRFVSWCRIIFGFTRVLNIGNVSRVIISNIVGDGLGATIRKKDIVLAIGSISITSFIVSKVNTRVVISNSIGKVVVGRSFIGRCRFVCRCMVNRGMVDRYMVNRSMVDSMMDWSMMNRGMVDNRGMVYRGMVNTSMVNRGMMNRSNGMVYRCMSSKLEVRVARHISADQGQKSRKGNKYLKVSKNLYQRPIGIKGNRLNQCFEWLVLN